MHIFPFLQDRLNDPALLPNLIAAVALALLVQLPAWLMRRLLRHCGGRLSGWTGSRLLGDAGQEAARRAQGVLFWLTLAAVLSVLSAGVVYHLAGRDVRVDAGAWLDRFTPEDWLRVGPRLGGLALLLAGLWLTARWARRTRTRLEGNAPSWLARTGNEDELRRSLVLLERFAVAGAVLATAWAAGRILGLPAAIESVLGLFARLTLYLAAVRLVPPAARLLTGPAADLGDRTFTAGRPLRYWERVRGLLPFGQRCLTAAVYAYAASLALRELHFLTALADYGPKIARCAAILFGCQVVIEFSQVFFNEAFGLYDEKRASDQKGQTLVPLLNSVCKYLLYFGSAVVMLGVLGVNTGPLLAGAGLLGLAVGLGSQSLVADLVSGFFILFEGQFLVGDYIEIGDASGRVEAFSIRNTQVRDAQGKLHLIPNGEIRRVVSSSKGFVNAVVELKLPAGSDLEAMLEALREAARRLRQEHGREVLGETEVKGLVDLGPSDMTARAVTRVRPGSHETMANEYRRLLKRVLDERAAGVEKKAA
jgi:small-conductance mechanosensitive channel